LNAFTEFFQLMKTVTILRVINLFKVWFSYYISLLFRKVIHWGMPLSISIEPINRCNLSCPECPTGAKKLQRKVGAIPLTVFKNIIDQVYRKTFYLSLYFQGEPYLHPELFTLISYARSKKMYVATSTNGHFLNEVNCAQTIDSGLNKLIVSIDGTTQETYEKYRIGGHLDSLIQGLQTLVNMKKELKSNLPLIEIQFIVFKHNEHQIDDIKKLAKQKGIDRISIKRAQIYDFRTGNISIPENNKYSRYKKTKEGTYVLKSKLYNHCWRSWHSCVITWDGLVVPCCFDKDAFHVSGNISDSSFQEIWKGTPFKQFREHILKNRKGIEICTNCIEGTKIRI